MKTIAIIFSDLHLSIYNQFNEANKRTLNHFKVLSIIKDTCIKHNCVGIFCGDMFHTPEVMSNELLSLTCKHFKELDKTPWELYAISGNHDLQKINSIESHSPSYMRSLASLTKFLKPLDFHTKTLNVHGVDFSISGVPYIDHNLKLSTYLNQLEKKKNHILLLHSDFPNAQDTDGRVIGSSENINTNLFSKFKLVLLGHIHKPQRLSKGIYMIGAPLQQRRTDRDCDLGYWKLHEDFSMEFVSMQNRFPKFIDVSSEEEIIDSFNYYTVVTPKTFTNKTKNPIRKGLSKRGIVRRYMKVKGIKDKEKRNLLYKLLENDNS